MRLVERIEELIYQKADDFKISKAIKEHIRDYLGSLDEIFVKKQGKDFLVRHTKAIDDFITIIYKYTIRKYFGNYIPFTNAIPITLVSMGSYGREELCIYSDIDLMIVYKDIKGYNLEPIIEDMLILAWDAGMKLGHRVHKVNELFEASNEDLSIKTAMMESRFLCGSKILWIETQNEIEKIRNYKRKETIISILENYKKRKQENPIKMEPNLKENEGGLRDANTLFWICKIIFNIEKLKDLSDFVLSEDEYKEFRTALEFLYRARSATHLSAKKKQDVLNLDLIPDVAKKLGFKDKVLKNAQMQLSHKILQSMDILHTTCDIFLKKVTSSLLSDTSNIKILRHSRIKKGIYICNNTVYASFKNNKTTLNEVLEELINFNNTENLKFDISYVDYIRKCTYTTHNSNKTYQLFKKIFYKEYIYQILRTLNKASLLQQLAKPFKRVRYLAQFDGYHKYPVDKHTLRCIYHLENIKDDFIKNLYKNINSDYKATLRLALFFHDIGKGKKGDHSEIGAKIFKAYAKKLRFSQELIDYGIVLIKYHTLMNNVANREDIYSERVVLNFVSKIQNKNILDLLYILTYADINGVGPNVYNSFIAKLLRELYEKSLKSFEKPHLISETNSRRRRENLLKKSQKFKELSSIQKRKILNIQSSFFFLKYKSDQIIDLAKRAFETDTFRYNIHPQPHLTVEVFRNTDFNLGYFLGKLSFLDLVSMEIYKLFDNKKYFKLEFSKNIEQEDLSYVKEIIEDSFDMKKKFNIKKPVIREGEISIECEHSETYAKMSINTLNQKGMMAYLMSVFDDKEIDIALAKIQTIKNRARNLILIEKTLYLCQNKEEILKGIVTCAE